MATVYTHRWPLPYVWTYSANAKGMPTMDMTAYANHCTTLTTLISSGYQISQDANMLREQGFCSDS